MRNLASIQKITKLSPIEGADKIEVAEILGWKVVVKKNDFTVDELVVYCEIDSVLPDKPEFEFLKPRKFKIKTIKLRNQISQGIAFKLNEIPEIKNGNNWKEGDDITDLLGIKKYLSPEELEEENIKPVFDDRNKLIRFYKKYRYFIIKYFKKLFGIPTLNKREYFPSYIPKTDETRVQSIPKDLYYNSGKIAYISEKLDGSSGTFIFKKKKKSLFKKSSEFIVCSRNRKVNNRDDTKWKIAKKYNIEKKLSLLNRNIAIQGEVIGPKVQKNIYELSEIDFRIFLIYDIDKRSYLPFNEFISLSKKIDIPTVPILETEHIVHTNIDEYVELSKGKSILNPKRNREGIVIRLKDSSFSFKSINPDHLLSEKD